PVRPDIGTFLRRPTLEALTGYLGDTLGTRHNPAPETGKVEAGNKTRSTWELMELRRGGPNGPVVITINHPFFYYQMANCFAPGTTIANLRIPDHQSVEAQRHLGFSEICMSAARAVEEVYGRRTLVLLGLCVNGHVALQVAQQLKEIGADVAGIAMIDTWSPRSSDHQSRIANAVRRWTIRGRRWMHFGRHWRKGTLSSRDLLAKNKLGERLIGKLLDTGNVAAEILLLETITNHLVERSNNFVFKPYDGTAILFKTEANSTHAMEKAFGWGGILNDDCPVYAVNGWHDDVLVGWDRDKAARIIEKRILDSHGTDRETSDIQRFRKRSAE
ncbi:MAG: hypothetical protein ACK5JT_07205, partial [Hyphomicrobiaceae bacterium]